MDVFIGAHGPHSGAELNKSKIFCGALPSVPAAVQIVSLSASLQITRAAWVVLLKAWGHLAAFISNPTQVPVSAVMWAAGFWGLSELPLRSSQFGKPPQTPH